MRCEVCSTLSFRGSFCEAGSAHPEEEINGHSRDAGKGCWEPGSGAGLVSGFFCW